MEALFRHSFLILKYSLFYTFWSLVFYGVQIMVLVMSVYVIARMWSLQYIVVLM